MSSPSPMSFFALPLEIRLQIYNDILYSTPANHIYLATTWDSSPSDPQPDNPPHSLFPQSPFPEKCMYKIPTNLLCTSKRVYYETRVLPFEKCLFSFISQYHSSLYSSTAFLSSLQQWQRESIRFVEIDLLRRELCTREESVEPVNWRKLCAMCGNVRYFRIVLHGSSLCSTGESASGWSLRMAEHMKGLGLLKLDLRNVEGDVVQEEVQFAFLEEGSDMRVNTRILSCDVPREVVD